MRRTTPFLVPLACLAIWLGVQTAASVRVGQTPPTAQAVPSPVQATPPLEQPTPPSPALDLSQARELATKAAPDWDGVRELLDRSARELPAHDPRVAALQGLVARAVAEADYRARYELAYALSLEDGAAPLTQALEILGQLPAESAVGPGAEQLRVQTAARLGLLQAREALARGDHPAALSALAGVDGSSAPAYVVREARALLEQLAVDTLPAAPVRAVSRGTSADAVRARVFVDLLAELEGVASVG